MLAVPSNYVGSVCEVKSMDNKLILTGYLGKIGPEEIQISRKFDPLPIIHCNTTVKVSIYNTSLGFRILVGKVYLSTQEFIKIADIQSEVEYEKRNFFRVKVEIKTEAYQEDENGHPVRSEPPIPVFIKDLSLSGLFFTTPRKMKIGDQVSIRLDLYNTRMYLRCKIVRQIVSEFGPENGYGCEFLDNTGYNTDLLCKYLFDCQREEIRKIKEQTLI
ncbi:MAG: PilZ domain-containing protein [Oscillospiraceae bacterium]|jgi:hypothetical protein